MNSTSLNAVAQRTRSESTAKISPRIVMTVGATTTQMRLFLTARKVEWSVNTWP